MPIRQKQQYAVTLANALKKWSEESGITLTTLRVELGVDSRSWRDVLSGTRIIEDRKPDLYARLLRRTGLLEADPTAIPNRGGSAITIRRWTFAQLVSWWKSEFPDEFETEEVQFLLARTRGAKDSHFHFEMPDGEESAELIQFKDFLIELVEGDMQFREQFCKNNRILLRKIIELMRVLNSNPTVREEILKLQGVLNE